LAFLFFLCDTFSVSFRVTQGELPKHAGVDFTKWGPLRSKVVVQVFADFLVACKKDEHGKL
jgi:hypothetical protein